MKSQYRKTANNKIVALKTKSFFIKKLNIFNNIIIDGEKFVADNIENIKKF